MRASRLGEVREGFDPDAKRGKVETVREMLGGGGSSRESGPIPWLFLFFFLFSFGNHALFVLGTKSLMQREL